MGGKRDKPTQLQNLLLVAVATALAMAVAVALATATLTAVASAVPDEPCPAHWQEANQSQVALPGIQAPDSRSVKTNCNKGDGENVMIDVKVL